MATIVGLIGNAVVLVALWCIWISRNDPRKFLEITDDLASEAREWSGPQPFAEKALHAATFIGMVVFSFGGFYAAFSWIPDNWGVIDEDGEWSTFRVSLCTVLAPTAAYAFYQMVRQDCIRRYQSSLSTNVTD